MLKNRIMITCKLRIVLAVILPVWCLSVHAQEFFHETFATGGADWIKVDADGDGRNWGLMDVGLDDQYSMASASVEYGEDSDLSLSPDNWLISPLIDLTSEEANDLVLLYYIRAWDPQYPADRYRVYVRVYESESESEPVSADDFTQTVKQETLTAAAADGFGARSINLSFYAGKKVRIAFRHFSSTNQSLILLDDIAVKSAVKGSDLIVEQLITPYYYNNLGKELPVKIRIANIGLEAATGVVASYGAPGRTVVKENLPDIAAGTSTVYEFTQKIAPYDVILSDAKIETMVSASNDGNAANNSLTETFNVFPPTVMKTWSFENDTEKTSFRTDFKKTVEDEYRVSLSMIPFFPANEAWTLLVADPTNFPTEYWGQSFLAGTSSFSMRGQADRWLILPKTLLDGTQILFTWTGATYSSGGLTVSEEYQVLVSETGANPEDFVQVGSYLEMGNIGSPSQRMLNLSQYAGKEVYVAFRNVSNSIIQLAATMTFLDNFVFYSYKPVGSPTDIDSQMADRKLTVFPNPVADVLNVNCSSPVRKISLFDPLGQLVYSLSGKDSYEVNVSHLPSNFYLLRVETEDGNVLTRKIIKK